MGIFNFHFLFYIYSIYLSNSCKFCKFFALNPEQERNSETYIFKKHVRKTYILEEGEQNYSVKTLPTAAY